MGLSSSQAYRFFSNIPATTLIPYYLNCDYLALRKSSHFHTVLKHENFTYYLHHLFAGKLRKKKWENAMTIDRRSWGFRREANLNDYLTIQELIHQLVTTVR